MEDKNKPYPPAQGEPVASHSDVLELLKRVKTDLTAYKGSAVELNLKTPMSDAVLRDVEAFIAEQPAPVAVVRYSDAPEDIPVTRIAHNVEFIRRVEPVAPEPHGDAYNGFVQTAPCPPAGKDYVSMRYAHIVGNGKCPVPITHTQNGVIVNLDGYTCYAPGAEPSSKKERLSVGDVYNSCLEVLGRPSVTLRTSEELAKKLNARLNTK